MCIKLCVEATGVLEYTASTCRFDKVPSGYIWRCSRQFSGRYGSLNG